jgi:hypothetical protein
MDNLDNRTPLQTDANDLQAQLSSLQHLVVSILILLVVLSGTLNIYLLRQWVWAKRELAGIRPQATQAIADYQRQSAPLMNDFVKKITDYGRTHPDFTPILAKYNLKPGAAPTAPAPTVSAPHSTPAAPPTKK